MLFLSTLLSSEVNIGLKTTPIMFGNVGSTSFFLHEKKGVFCRNGVVDERMVLLKVVSLFCPFLRFVYVKFLYFTSNLSLSLYFVYNLNSLSLVLY